MDQDANTCELKQSFTTTSCPGSDVTNPTKIQLCFREVTPGFTGVNETRLLFFHSFFQITPLNQSLYLPTPSVLAELKQL